MYEYMTIYSYIVYIYSILSIGYTKNTIGALHCMDKLLGTLSDYLKAAGAIITQYAPKVWGATLHLVFWTSLINLLFLALCTVTVLVIWVWPWRKWFKWNLSHDWDSEGSCIGFAISTFALTIGTLMIVDGWGNSLSSWLGVIDPQLAVLYKLAVNAGVL